LHRAGFGAILAGIIPPIGGMLPSRGRTMGRLRLNPDRVLTPAERLKRFRDRRRGLPVAEAPRVVTPGRALAEAMEACGVPLATAADLVSETVGNSYNSGEGKVTLTTLLQRPAPGCPLVGPATPLRFDPKALIG
jgi:hypothetical protein